MDLFSLILPCGWPCAKGAVLFDFPPARLSMYLACLTVSEHHRFGCTEQLSIATTAGSGRSGAGDGARVRSSAIARLAMSLEASRAVRGSKPHRHSINFRIEV